MNFLITICGRGGSKGIPGKNIKLINGLPLIAYSIKTAKEFANIHKADIALSTDDFNIKKVAEHFGLFTNYIRPEELGTDAIGKIDVLKDVINYEEVHRYKQYDYILDLDITSPLRTISDLNEAFLILQNDTNALNLFSVNKANRNPYFNMVEENEQGYYSLVKKLPNNLYTRQSSPKVYDLNASFYFYKRNFFSQNNKSAITDKSLVFIMPHICFDLDEIHDFEFMNYLISSNKLGFDL